MSILGRTALKEFFETDDFPTQAQFADFIDSYLNDVDDHYLTGGEDNITAHAGGGQGSAFQLTKAVNRVTVVASYHDSVKLPKCKTNLICTARNTGAESLNLYPFLGDEINELGTNTPLGVASSATLTFFGLTNLVWVYLI